MLRILAAFIFFTRLPFWRLAEVPAAWKEEAGAPVQYAGLDFTGGLCSRLYAGVRSDEVLLLPIYPAREEPIEGIASEIIAERVTVPCRIVGREALAATLGAAATDVVVSFGAGNIDACCDAVADVLRKKA